jgi:hypothetical protein
MMTVYTFTNPVRILLEDMTGRAITYWAIHNFICACDGWDNYTIFMHMLNYRITGEK